MDVIEIDAASNRGINEMRELRENVRFRPARDRYKVFIVDEAHQITSEAFNALLKTLEEPPEWVVFMLCTTEAHKIPSTIASRCQQFSFRSVDFEELVARMDWICRQEGIQADPEVLACWRRRAKAACAIRSRRSIRPSPAAATRSKPSEVRALLADVLARVAGRGDRGAGRRASPGRMLDVVDDLERNGRNLQHFAASWLAISAICWWCGSRDANAAGRRVAAGAARRLAETAGAVHRRRSDAVSAARARSVPRFAVLAAAAAASGDGPAAADPRGAAACRSRKRWRTWAGAEIPEARPGGRKGAA